jgi:hypothetical protein
MGSLLATAFLNPLNLAMLAVSVVAGLLAAWWMFPAGLVVWAIMIWRVASDPDVRLRHMIHSRAPLPQRFESLFDPIERSQLRILRAIATARARPRRALSIVEQPLEELVDQAHALCVRMTPLENFRQIQAGENIERDLARLDDQIARAQDEVIKRELGRGRDALALRVTRLRDVMTQLDRVEAQLTSLRGELDGVLTDVVRAQSLNAQPIDQQAMDLVQKLQRLQTDFTTFEEEMSEAG